MSSPRALPANEGNRSSTPEHSWPSKITDTPKAGQAVRHEGKDYLTIREGSAFIMVPKPSEAPAATGKSKDTPSQTVFYNPIQQFNRDLTVLAIRTYGQDTLAVRRQKWEHRPQGGNRDRRSRKRKRGSTEPKDADGSPAATDSKVSVEDGQRVGEEVDSTPAEAAEETSKVIEPTKAVRHPFRILDGLSATGLRALRFAQEIPFATSITANDMMATATDSIKLNIQLNGVADRVRATTSNASAHMYGATADQGKYDVIDLDPYGTAAPFFDSAVQALKDGGLLCATCTDPGVFASTGYPEKTYALYGGAPIKGPHSHEAGLRLILQAIATSAARYGLAIEPLLSLSIDYYARIFVRIRRSPAEVKLLAGKTMLVYSCDQGCGAWTTQLLAKNREMTDKIGGKFYKYGLAQAPSAAQQCEHCAFKTHLAGPMYAGPIHSPTFVKRILDELPGTDEQVYGTKTRIEGMLLTALEEDISPHGPADTVGKEGGAAKVASFDPGKIDHHPFFFIPSALAKVFHCRTPDETALRGALRHLGYRVTRSHCKAGSVKTDAPWAVVWEVMREWVRQKAPVKEGAIKEGTAGWAIMKRGEELGQENGQQAAQQYDDPAKTVIGAAPEAGSEQAATGHPAQVEPEQGRRRVGSRVRFDDALGRLPARKGIVRYQVNPRSDWGPMNRARGSSTQDT